MTGFSTDIEQATLDNDDFRRVLFTGRHSQLVLMSLQPKEDIGVETHEGIDQFIRVEAGTGKAIVDGQEIDLHDGTAIVIPAGAEHNVINTSAHEPLKLYSIYSPPEHDDGTVHPTKADALKDEHAHQH